MSSWADGLMAAVSALGASAAVCAGAVAAARLLRIDLLVNRSAAPGPDPREVIDLMAELAGLAKREGLLSLEGHLKSLGNPLLTAGVGMAIDGVPADRIELSLLSEAEADLGDSRAETLLERYPVAVPASGAAMIVGAVLGTGGTMAGIGAIVGGVGAGVFFAGILIAMRLFSPPRGVSTAAAGRAMAGMLTARGVALIRQGFDGPATRAALSGLLPPRAQEAAARAQAA